MICELETSPRHFGSLLVIFALFVEAFVLPNEAQSQFIAGSQFTKLPLSINTPDRSELLPVVSADGKTLYFTRRRIGIDSSPVFDIWRSQITGDTAFSAPEFIGGNLSSSYGIAVTSVSPDNNTLYLIGKMQFDSPPDERLYVTHKFGNGWSIPEPLKIKNLNARGVSTDYSFGPDQRTLLLAVNRDSSLGGQDIYVSFFDDTTRSWRTPRWLGPDVNSEYTEMTPYLASDNKTLYFSSDRPDGIGEVDVYRSMRLDSTWRHWSKAEDLGPTINRPGRTTYYSEDAAAKYAYICWRASMGDVSSIYRVKVEHARAVALIHGIVTDANGKPLSAKIRYERLIDGAILGTARSDPSSGEFQISLPAGEDYALHADRDGYFPTSEHVDLKNLTSFQSIQKDLKLTRIESGVAITMKNVFFESDKSVLLPASFPELDRVKELLDAHT